MKDRNNTNMRTDKYKEEIRRQIEELDEKMCLDEDNFDEVLLRKIAEYNAFQENDNMKLFPRGYRQMYVPSEGVEEHSNDK